MATDPSYVFESLDLERHDRRTFCSGVAPLDRYLQRFASQDASEGVAVTWVLIWSATPSQIIGYYTLSSTSIPLTDVPETLAKKLPSYPNVPATLIGRLAVDQTHRGEGLGARFLTDALYRAAHASATIASAAVIVDAKDETAASFYKKHGFTPFPTPTHRRLFLPMPTIKKAFKR